MTEREKLNETIRIFEESMTPGRIDNECVETAINTMKEKLASLPKEPKFWEGQLCEFSDFDDFCTSAIGFFCEAENGKYTLRDNGNIDTVFSSCRPLKDPLILQFKPFKPGDPMPCDGDLEVWVLLVSGEIRKQVSSSRLWGNTVGWIPVGGW